MKRCEACGSYIITQEDIEELRKSGYGHTDPVGEPTADVEEVVRCKDCKHYKGEQFNCWLMRTKMRPTDYCSYGERREK